MEKPSLIVARALPDAMMQGLAQIGDVQVYDVSAADPIPDGTQIWVSTAVDPAPAELIKRFPDSLGLIANIGVGTDNIDLQAAADRGVLVSNTPVVTEDTADLTMALLLATCRRTGTSERLLRDGNWAAGAAQLGQRVHGKTLGIIGFGAIGQAVARRARGFDMRVLYHGPRPKAEAAQAVGAEYCDSLGALLGESDIVSLNCPLTNSTRHLINTDTLGQMKAGSILINTGRGPLVDEAALVEALKAGQLSAAGLDVYEFEPKVTPALLTMDNVTLLPHIGSATAECRMDMALRAIANMKSFLEKGEVRDPCLPG